MPNNQGICFVSHNKNKLAEISKIAPNGFLFYGLEDLGLEEEIPETGNTIEENSALKARFVFDHYHMSCFADDTGLEIPALNNAPGVYSARYAGEEKDAIKNMDLVLKKLEGIDERHARFKTVITYISENGQLVQFEGIVEGEILKEKRGSGGFGYDPIFMPAGYSLTFAEMTMDQKNAISHRARAFDKFFGFLTSR